MCIEEVERGLPKGLVDTMVISRATESDWKKWLEAVRAVNIRKVKDHIAELRDRERMKEWMERMEQTAATPNPTYPPYTPRPTKTYQSAGTAILQQKMD